MLVHARHLGLVSWLNLSGFNSSFRIVQQVKIRMCFTGPAHDEPFTRDIYFLRSLCMGRVTPELHYGTDTMMYIK